MTMKVEYIDHMGDDLSVVNAARVSFDKISSLDEEGNLQPKDIKLIQYLSEHNHWTPFSHTAITVRVTAPIFVRTQCFKHKVGFTENEISRRYVDSEPEFFKPEVWRRRDKNLKQGSQKISVDAPWYVNMLYDNAIAAAEYAYREMLAADVAPELARMMLPQCMITSWYWTGSLVAYARFYKLRTHETAQAETSEIAEKIYEICTELFPYSWNELSI